MTSLSNGRRVSKNDTRIEVCGAIDELAAALGMTLALRYAEDGPGVPSYQVGDILGDLMVLGAAVGGATKATHGQPLRITSADVERLEGWIDDSEAKLEPLKNFILPTGSLVGASLHQARTICRRAERRCWGLSGNEKIGGLHEGLAYLNRLSDLCFSWARLSNKSAHVQERIW